MINFDMIFQEILSLPPYLQKEYFNKCQKESGYSVESFWIGLNSEWLKWKGLIIPKIIPHKIDAQGEAHVYNIELFRNHKTRQEVEHLWMLIYIYWLDFNNGKVCPFVDLENSGEIKNLCPKDYFEISSIRGEERLKHLLKDVQSKEELNELCEREYLRFLKVTNGDYKGKELSNWWVDAFLTLLKQVNPFLLLGPPIKIKPKVTDPMKSLFCYVVNLSNLDPKSENETIDNYVKRICQRFSLSYSGHIRKQFGAGSENFTNYKAIQSNILPYLENDSHRTLLEDFIERRMYEITLRK